MRDGVKNTISVLAVGLASLSNGAIEAVSDDFSSNGNTFPQWADVGSSPTVIHYHSTSAGDYDDGDASAKLPWDAGSMQATGDGVHDGGLRLNSQDSVAGNEATGLIVGGLMENDELITFSGSIYNDNGSYANFIIQLWNLTDNVLLDATESKQVRGVNAKNYVPQPFSISHTAEDSDVGDVLQVRIVENGNHVSRDVYVDNFSVSSILPLPPALGILGFVPVQFMGSK